MPQRRALTLPLCTFVALSSVFGVYCGKGSSNSPTAPTASAPKSGAFSVSTFSVSLDQTSTEHRYALRLSVRETGGQMGGTLGTVESTLIKDGITIGTATLENVWVSTHVNAGATADARPITLTNSLVDRQVGTRVTVKVNYVDDGQKSGSVTASADVPQPAGPPPAPAVSYTLSCTVQDDDTNSFLADARVEIVGGANVGRVTQTASNGQCSLPGLAPGGFTVRVTKGGYQSLDRSVTLGADSRVEFKLKKTAPAPTPPPPTPPPPPPPGPGEIPICTGSVPSNVDCGKPTARCNDNEWSCSQNRSGTCSSHQGVACWVCPGALCNGLQAPAGMTFR